MIYLEGYTLKRWQPVPLVHQHIFDENGKKICTVSSLTAGLAERYDLAVANSLVMLLFRLKRWCWRHGLIAKYPDYKRPSIGFVASEIEYQLKEGESLVDAAKLLRSAA